MTIRTIGEVLKETYGTRIYKLSLSSGCTCPGRDGTLESPCTFCSQEGSGEFAASFAPIGEQIEEAKRKVSAKMASIPEASRRYIAYFQSYTNTYGDIDRLRALYLETILRPEIVILDIATRPDCLSDEVLSMLKDLAEIKPVWVELGLQTADEETARHIRRGYPNAVFEKAYRDLTALGIPVIVHVILGLPGETKKDCLNTMAYLSRLTPTPGVKLQLLHVLSGTALEKEYEETHFHVLTLEEYTDLVVSCIRALPPDTIYHRLTGAGKKSELIAPLWSADKKRVMNTLRSAIAKA